MFEGRGRKIDFSYDEISGLTNINMGSYLYYTSIRLSGKYGGLLIVTMKTKTT